jgi:hypothetical protein
METQLFAPEIDYFIDGLNREPAPLNFNIFRKLKIIYDVFRCVKISGGDDYREIWLESETGPIEIFGDFEEYKESGEVDTYEDFEDLWRDYYPDETKWYKFQTAKLFDNLYFYLGGKLLWTIPENECREESDKRHWDLEYFERFAGLLSEKIAKEIIKLREDVNTYNLHIQEHLPWSKRLGKIVRKDFWEIMGTQTIRPDINLGAEMIEKFKRAVKKKKEHQLAFLDEMTANFYFRVCEICYDANDYFKNKAGTLTPLDKYLSYADGRDAGLRDIEGDSPEAFTEWYYGGSRMGAHPWEICRGGNSTHMPEPKLLLPKSNIQ